MKKNIAVILFNIGGPENLTQIKPYLFNFFSDKFIITAPYLIRKMLAFLICQTRSSKTKSIYSKIGGKSFSKENTLKQANALEEILNSENSEYFFKTYICMSYWHPMYPEVLDNLSKDHSKQNFEKIVYLPLYPQFSTTTTQSSFFYIKEELKKQKFKNLEESCEHKFVCCYFDDKNFIKAHVEILAKKFKEAWEVFEANKTNDQLSGMRILFSAHSIPEKLTYGKEKNGAGDPYQFQVRKTVELIMIEMQKIFGIIDFDFLLCYQSKVGPIKWLSPSTEDEVLRCAKEKLIPIIVPVAFVSENSETIYELDIEYKELLESQKMKYIFRCQTLSLNEKFLESLKEIVLKAVLSQRKFINSENSCSKCEQNFFACPNKF